MQSREHIFDNTLGVRDESSWLDRKVLRRELTDSLNRQSLSERTEKAEMAKENFLGDLSRRAQLREGVEKKSEQIRKQHEEALRRKADEYRERLRKYLPKDRE